MKVKKIFIAGLATILVVSGGIYISISAGENLYLAKATENAKYSLKLNGENRITAGYNGQDVEKDIYTDLGNPITFVYKNLMYSTNSNKNFAQFKNGGSYIYNKDAVSYISCITINYIADSPMRVAVGSSMNPTSFQTIENGVPLTFNETCNYFAITTGGSFANVVDVKIEYLCKKGGTTPDIPVEPDTSDSSSSSDTTPVPGGSKNVTFTTKNVEGIIPTSYTSSGTKFKAGDINFFSNYVTDGINSKSYKNYFYMRENGLGFIMNTNPINGLASLSFDGSVNPSVLNVYASKEFNKNWVKINANSTNISFNEGYAYFKISTDINSDLDFAFKSLTINYNNADQAINNETYNVKKINPVTQEEVNTLITTSSAPFTNNAYWVSKGYAKDINEANQDKTNKVQSGYEGHADYQIEYNPDVVVDEQYKSYRVADMTYGDNGNSFRINMLDGSQGPVIYKDCAYTYIEDIAAYITAFGDAPVNMRYSAGSKRAINDWGLDGRSNYAAYSNDNAHGNFKYETECSTHRYFFNPKQNSNDYWYNYYESDYGASVTNDEPYQKNGKYGNKLHVYNDGNEITRGALRFVWSKSFTDSEHSDVETTPITNAYDRNVFYSSTHYADFQQYLNYYHGWSIKFGNSILGNYWDSYVSNNHLHASPEVTLVSLKDLQK